MGLLYDKDDPSYVKQGRALAAFYAMVFGLALAVVVGIVLILWWGLF